MASTDPALTPGFAARRTPPYGMRFRMRGHRSIGPADVRAAISAGLSQSLAARLWGLSVTYVSRTTRSFGMCWPNMARMRTARWVWLDGQYVTIAMAAKLQRADRRLHKKSLYRRFHAGIRGAGLFAPATIPSAPSHYTLGLNHGDWMIVLKVADKIGDDATRHRFGVPQGAIAAARRGEWERLG